MGLPHFVQADWTYGLQAFFSTEVVVQQSVFTGVAVANWTGVRTYIHDNVFGPGEVAIIVAPRVRLCVRLFSVLLRPGENCSIHREHGGLHWPKMMNAALSQLFVCLFTFSIARVASASGR